MLANKFSQDREELARVAVYLGDVAEVVHPQIQRRSLKMIQITASWNVP
ncbi:MAG: hypothetical protein V3T42_10170 [Nitrospirales bacterium]